MNRSEFLNHFKKHLRKYGNDWHPQSIILRLNHKECPLPIAEKWTNFWEKQSQYYGIYKRKGNLTQQMISIVKKFYKIS
jgi:hypothetical protein